MCSCKIHKHVFPSTSILCRTCLCCLLFMPHSCSQISLCGKGPFGPCASYRYLVSSVSLMPKDPLAFPVMENCPIPANFQPFFSVLTARTYFCPVPHISLTLARLTRLSSVQSLQASHKAHLFHGKTSPYIVFLSFLVTSWCSTVHPFFSLPSWLQTLESCFTSDLQYEIN